MTHSISFRDLPNGARLLLIQVPNAISAYFSVHLKSGYRFVGKDKFELPHLLEHVLFEGNTQFPSPDDFKYEMERHGTYFNAYTNNKRNWYEYITTPDKLLDVAEMALFQVYQPLINENPVLEERKVIESELHRRLSDPLGLFNYLNGQVVQPNLYPDLLKRIAGVLTLTNTDLRKYHSKFYVPANSSIVIAGDLSPQLVEGLVESLSRHLSSRDPGESHPYVPELPNGNIAKKIFILESPVEKQQQFMLDFITPGEDKDSLPALRVLSVMSTGGISARLSVVCRKAGLTYSIRSFAGSNLDLTRFSLKDQSIPEKFYDLFELAVREFADLAAGNFTEKEFSRAVGYLAGGFKRSHENPASLANWYASDFVAEEELEDPMEFAEKIAQLKPSDVVRAAKKYATGQNWTLSLMGSDLEENKKNFQEVLDKYFPPRKTSKNLGT